MNGRKWMFWQRKEDNSSSHSRAEIEACREWTPFLTALFDGEADEDGALQARRHLLVCERCARTWFDWNQTRNLLINHSAPPPPPSLLWRVRLACRLGHPEATATPDLSAQILSRTSRPTPKPAFGSWLFSFVPRGFRFNSPVVGALALGAFVLLASRASFLEPQSRNVSSTQLSSPRATVSSNSRIASSGSNARDEVAVLAPRAKVVSARILPQPRVLSVAASKPKNGFAERSLLRARREREALEQAPVQLAAFDSAEPLAMLAPPRVRRAESKKAPRRVATSTRAPRVSPRPMASSSRLAAPSVVLASAPVTSLPLSVPEPVMPRAGRGPRVLLASAPLRVSTPRALPITMSQAPAPDDAGLDDLDSTVQEYRTALADDSFDSSDAG